MSADLALAAAPSSDSTAESLVRSSKPDGRAPSALRIAFIGARGVQGTYSGIETYYEEVGSRLVARGHDVTAYCRSYFTEPIDRYRGIRVRRLPCLRSKHLETPTHSLLATLDSLVRNHDIVQLHALGSAPLAWPLRWAGKKTVVSVRGLDWRRAKWGRFARRILRTGEWTSVRAPHATVVVSETLREHFARHHGRDTHCIPNALPTIPPPPDPAVESRRLELLGLDSGRYLLYAGRLSPEKNVETLIEAVTPHLDDVGLVLAGGSSHTRGYVRRLRSLASDPRIRFLGQVDHETVGLLQRHCRAYVLPSSMEGLSVSLLEAVAFGSCILASDIPENREVVGDAALLFPVGDVAALRAQIARVATRPELVESMRERARECARRHPDWDDVALATERLYYGILTGTELATASTEAHS